MYLARNILLSVLTLLLAGCGLAVPELQEFYQSPKEEKIDENAILSRITCEMTKSVYETLHEYRPGGQYTGKSVEWLLNWGAMVTLKISAEEASAIKPGFSIPAVPGLRRLSIGGGLSASSNITRAETIGATYAFRDLLEHRKIPSDCDRQGPILITSDLKIKQFISNKAFLAAVPGTIPDRAIPFDAFTYQATFVVVYSGGITPTYHFIDVTANPDSPFLNASRTRTHDITLTVGPTYGRVGGRLLLSQRAQEQNYTQVLSQSIATATRFRFQ